jgi:hypothetical protein
MNATRRGRGLKGGSIVKGFNTNNATLQRHDNWEQHEILVFLKCKYDEHAIQKAFMDPRTHMIPIAK